jgi:hypothetical protein
MKSMMILVTLLGAFGAQAMTPMDSASLLAKGQWETGLFGPTRIGLSSTMELRLHPVVAALSPNAVLRMHHGTLMGGALVGEYGMSVPTYGLRQLQGEGAGKLFPGDYEIPWMVVPRAGAVWSRGNERRTYTARMDLALAVPFANPDRSVQSPGEGWLDLLFAPATDGYRARLGGLYDRALTPRLRSRTSVDVYATGNADNPFMVLGRQVVDIGLWKGRDGRWNKLSVGAAWLNSNSHAFGGARSNDFMPIIDLVF